MPIQHTTRLQLPYPKDTAPRTDSADVPRDVHAPLLILDSAAIDDQGILADRPVSTGGTPGIPGRYYMVKGDPDPAQNDRLYRDHGTGWDELGSVASLAGALAARPAAASVRSGTKFFATDQVAEYRSDGTATWTRISTPAGSCAWIFADTADPGYILVAGQAWPATTGIYADLYAKWSARFPTALPDAAGRFLIAKGSHADIDTPGKNDGLALSSRRPKHKTTIVFTGAPFLRFTAGDVFVRAAGDTSGTWEAPTATAGPQTGAEPVDTVPHIVANLQVKL